MAAVCVHASGVLACRLQLELWFESNTPRTPYKAQRPATAPPQKRGAPLWSSPEAVDDGEAADAAKQEPLLRRLFERYSSYGKDREPEQQRPADGCIIA